MKKEIEIEKQEQKIINYFFGDIIKSQDDSIQIDKEKEGVFEEECIRFKEYFSHGFSPKKYDYLPEHLVYLNIKLNLLDINEIISSIGFLFKKEVSIKTIEKKNWDGSSAKKISNKTIIITRKLFFRNNKTELLQELTQEMRDFLEEYVKEKSKKIVDLKPGDMVWLHRNSGPYGSEPSYLAPVEDVKLFGKFKKILTEGKWFNYLGKDSSFIETSGYVGYSISLGNIDKFLKDKGSQLRVVLQTKNKFRSGFKKYTHEEMKQKIKLNLKVFALNIYCNNSRVTHFGT